MVLRLINTMKIFGGCADRVIEPRGEAVPSHQHGY
jgi:hypothetical protein